MKKRLLSLMLIFAMVLGMVPMTALATDETGGYEGAASVTVTLSLSADDRFMVGPGTREVMAFKEITVPYFDLANYGLQEYYFVSESYGDDGDGAPGSDLQTGTAEYAYGKVTLLHLYIYALEVFYCGIDSEDAGQGYLYDEGLIGTEVFTISGGVGSSFMNQFWGGDCNLNYYVNYVYPLASDGWGATCDQILLRDGDIITLGNFSNYEFYSDPTSIFNYIVAGEDTVHTTVAQGEEVTLTVYCAGPNLGTSYDTAQNIVTCCPDVYYTPVDDLAEDVTSWTCIGTADENGQIVFDTSHLEPGNYLVCVPGLSGEYTEAICSTPGGIILTVEAAAPSNYRVQWEESENYTITGEATVEPGEDYVFTLDMTVGLRPKSVKANGQELVGINRKYKVENVTEDVTITVEAEEVELKPVTVWSEVTLGTDSIYQGGENNHLFNLQQVTVPYFDLGLYDLEEFYYNPDCYAEGSYDDGDLSGSRANQKPGTQATAYGVVTTMHLYIYMTEVLFCGLDPEDAGKGYLEEQGLIGADVNGDYNNFYNCLLYYTGTFGSTFMYLWNHGSNLNYYINYAYPLGAPGWGSTADQQALKDGDIISSHLIESNYAALSNYQFFVVNDKDGEYTFGEDQVGYATVEVGDSLDLTLFTCVTSYGEPTSHEPVDHCAVSYWVDEEHLTSYISDCDDGDWFLGIGEELVEYENDAPFPFDCDSFDGDKSDYWGIYAEGGTFTITATQPGTYYIAALGSDGSNGEAGAAVFKLVVLGDEECDHQGGTATCQEKAVCDLCGESYGELNASNHAGTAEWTKTADKHSKAWTCCDAVVVVEENHEWQNGVCTECGYDCAHSGGEATCQEKATCDICGEAYGVFADCVYDQLVVKNDYLASAATCTDDAVYYKSCVCGKQGSETFTVGDTALGHTWDGGVVTKKPTTGKEGVMTYTCTVCKDTYTESIARLPITPVGPSVSKPEEPEVPAEPEVTAPAYSDVKDEWFAAGVEYVTEKGLMNGVGDGKFGPNMNTSRGMIVTILWRLAGEPVPTAAAAFTDVVKGAYYEQGVAWAEQKGIVTGYGETFGPNDNITREQLAVMLYRYMGSPAVEGDLNAYSDGSQVSSYAVNAMIWAVQQGIFTGTGDGILAPQANATRAQVATILMRLLNK